MDRSSVGADEAGPPVHRTHWRYLWDSRRPCGGEPDNPVEIDVEACTSVLPDSLILHTGADPTHGSGGTGDEDDELAREIQELLSEHYVGDPDGEYRFALSLEYVKWAIFTPQCRRDLLICLREKCHAAPGDSTIKDDKKEAKRAPLAGFLAAVPLDLVARNRRSDEDGDPIAEQYCFVDFVCVRRDYRGQRLCPFMYGIAQDRCRRAGYDKLICTSGDLVPHPMCEARYFHRLNPSSLQFLVDINFWSPPCSRAVYNKIMSLPSLALPSSTGRDEHMHFAAAKRIRFMHATDVPVLRESYNRYIKASHDICLTFPSDESFGHTLLPRAGVVASFVFPGTDDFIAFNIYDTQILWQCPHQGKTFRVAQIYYSKTEMVGRRNAIVAALEMLFREDQEKVCVPKTEELDAPSSSRDEQRGRRVDVVNALADVCGNEKEILQDQIGFEPGTGTLKYYMYNSPFPDAHIQPSRVAWLTT